jgi:hypothetical protein
MPTKIDFKEIKYKHDCLNYFETGMWDPEVDISLKRALNIDFEKLYCLELLDKWVDAGTIKFKEHIDNNRLKIIKGDSSNMYKYLNSDDFNNKTLFFLDAHVDNANIKNYIKRCPLIEELKAIKNLNRKDHVILIDDLRIITTYAWHESSYGNINMLEECKKIISSINPDYKFEKIWLNGHAENDVLYCYV